MILYVLCDIFVYSCFVENSDMILRDKSLISDVVLSQKTRSRLKLAGGGGGDEVVAADPAGVTAGEQRHHHRHHAALVLHP
jgi:hypothetical protein